MRVYISRTQKDFYGNNGLKIERTFNQTKA